VLKSGAPADFLVAAPVEGSAGSTLSDGIAHGDLPGISHIFVDGEALVDGRSRQTPPPATPGRMLTVMLSGCCGCD
jgi:enamidase